VAKFMLSRAVRADGRKVVLTGEGSDELLAGYAPFRRDMLLYHKDGQNPAELEHMMAQLLASNQVSRGILLPEGESKAGRVAHNVLEFIPSWLDAQIGGVAKFRTMMRDDFLAAQSDTDTISSLLASIDVQGRVKGRNAVHAAMYLWAKTILPHYILSNLGDRMEMAHSIEGRVPFMDHTVAEYLQRTPVSMKIRGMTEKYILREAVKDVITKTVYERQKHPFLSPPATLHPDEPLHALLQDTLRGQAARDVPFLDQKKIVAVLDGLAGSDTGHRTVMDQPLMLALSYTFMHEGLGLSA